MKNVFKSILFMNNGIHVQNLKKRQMIGIILYFIYENGAS
jgi:hypothetical protein